MTPFAGRGSTSPDARVARLGHALRRAAERHRLGITARLGAALIVGTLLLATLAWAALSAIGSARDSGTHIYTDSVVTTQAISNLAARLDDAEEAVLLGLVTVDPARQAALTRELASQILPEVAVGVANVRAMVADNPAQSRVAGRLAVDWAGFTARLSGLRLSGGTLATRSAEAVDVKERLDRATEAAHSLTRSEAVEASQIHTRSLASIHSDVRRVLLLILASMVVAALLVGWLMHGLLPRLLAYARFAQRMVDGRLQGAPALPRRRRDRPALGRTLDEVAQRHRDDDRYDRTQAEFSDALQLTDDELAAQDLLRRHLERSIPARAVTVLNRNNSADRLEAVTCPCRRLAAARARCSTPARGSCLAVRGAAVHHRGSRRRAPLVRCELCSGLPGPLDLHAAARRR